MVQTVKRQNKQVCFYDLAMKEAMGLGLQASILLSKLESWFKLMAKKSEDRFYKYISPCASSRKGDTLAEETGLSHAAIVRAFDKIGVRYSSWGIFQSTPVEERFMSRDKKEMFFAAVYCRKDNKTYFYRNEKKFERLMQKYFPESLPKDSKQEQKQETTTNVAQEETPVAVVEPKTISNKEENLSLGIVVKPDEKVEKPILKSEIETMAIAPTPIASTSIAPTENKAISMVQEISIEESIEKVSTLVKVAPIEMKTEPEQFEIQACESLRKTEQIEIKFAGQQDELGFFKYCMDLQVGNNPGLNKSQATQFASNDISILKMNKTDHSRYNLVRSYYYTWRSGIPTSTLLKSTKTCIEEDNMKWQSYLSSQGVPLETILIFLTTIRKKLQPYHLL